VKTEPTVRAALRACGLTKRFRSATAVDDVSFTVEAGQVCALLGPNGAGKTTTMRMLVGLCRPDVGHAELFGVRSRVAVPALDRVGVVIDGPGLIPHLTGHQNLELLWTSSGRRWPPPGLDDALDLAGLGDAVNRRTKTYSTGMRQRLMLAQAFMGRPDALVLDEPANGLDPGEVKALRNKLVAAAATGMSVLISTHVLAEVELVASHVVVMNHGKVIAAGPLAKLTAATHATNPWASTRLEDVFLGLVAGDAAS
jgi:ABC-type multidrug transport system ATPase subunit